MPPVCFLDNDIILKLATCNLFSEAISSLGLDETDLRVLESRNTYSLEIERLKINILKVYEIMQF